MNSMQLVVATKLTANLTSSCVLLLVAQALRNAPGSLDKKILKLHLHAVLLKEQKRAQLELTLHAHKCCHIMHC